MVNWVAILLLLIAIGLIIAGVVLLANHRTPQNPAPLWYWGLVVGGVILIIIALLVWYFWSTPALTADEIAAMNAGMYA